MFERESQRAPGTASPASPPKVSLDASGTEIDEGVLDLGGGPEPAIELSSRPPVEPAPADERQGEPATDQVVDSLTRRRLFGLDFVDAPSLEPVIEAIVARHQPPGDHQNRTVLTPNVDIMVQLDRDPACRGTVRDMFESSQFCLPDGQPIVLASRVLGRPLAARLTGSGLFAALWPRLVADERSIYVVASSEEVATKLTEEYPAASTTVPPMFAADDVTAIEQIAKSIIASAGPTGPDFVFLGIGNPKDALIADAVLRLWPAELGRPPTLLGLGGSALMYVGITKRAPDWVQRVGMEWFYRFVQEPRRLFHRYFVRDSAFIGLVWREWRARRSEADMEIEG